MAPGLRSGRTGHPGAAGGGEDPGGRAPQRTDAGGERRCLRTGGLRAGGAGAASAAGMLANCLLSVAVLSLLARCAVAAEERSTYDASGSSPLPSDPVVTGVPARPLAEEVPFPVVRSDGDSEPEGEGLPGRPAFSSVLTVMAGTVKHPVSLDQSRTSPTITRDETHTTQWPSRSSSLGSDVSSSSYAGEKTLPAGSGLISNTFSQALLLTASIQPHVSGNRNASLSPPSPISPSPSESSVSSSAPSTSSVSLFYPSSSPEWTHRADSSQSQRMMSTPAPHTEQATSSSEVFEGWTERTTATLSTSYSVNDLEATKQTIESTTPELSRFPSEASSEKSNKVTKHSFYSSADRISVVSGNTKSTEPPAFITFTSSSTGGLSFFDVSNGAAETQNAGMSSVSSNKLEFDTLFPSNGESHAVRSDRQTPPPPSALTSARPKGSSVPNEFTVQTLNPTQSMDKGRTAVNRHTSDYKNNAAVSLLSSPKSPAMTFPHSGSLFTVSLEPEPGKTSLSAITELTRIRSGLTSPEHASNPADLLTAAGHSGPRVPAIDIIYNQGEKAGAELRSAFGQAHLNNSLSPTGPGHESTSGSVPVLSSRKGTTATTFEPDFLHSQKSRVENVEEVVSRNESSKDIWTPLNLIASTNRGTKSPSEPKELTSNMTQKTTFESSSHSTQPINLYLSDNPRSHEDTDRTTEVLPSSGFELAEPAEAVLPPQITSSERPLQARNTPDSPHRLYTPVFALKKSEQTVMSSAQTSAHIKSEAAFEVQTRTENNKTLQASSAQKWQRNKPTEVFYGDTAKTSPLYQVIEERTLIRDNVFYKKAVLSGQFTTRFPSFITTKDAFTLNQVSEGSGEKPAKIPFSAATSDAASDRLSRKGDVTSAGRYEEPPASLRSEITPTWGTKSSSHSQGPIAALSRDKSNFYFGGQTATVSAVPSAVTTSSGDWKNSAAETLGARTGTKQMTPYTERRAAEPMSFLSSAFKLESTSSGFDSVQSNLPADGQSSEHSMLQNRQEHNAHKSNSTDLMAAAGHPFPLRPNVQENPSFTDVSRLSEEHSPNMPSANLGSTTAASVTRYTTSVWGSNGFLPSSGSAADFVSSSQAASLAWPYGSEHSPPLADVHSTDSAVALSGNPSHSFSDTDTVGRTSASPLRRSTLPAHVASSSPAFYPPPLSTTQSPSFIKHSIFVPSSSQNPADVSSRKPTMFLGSTALVPIKSTFSSSSLTSSLHSGRSQKVTEMFVLAEAETDELAAGTSRAVAHTFPKEREASLAPSQSVRIPLSGGPTERTAQVSPLTPRQDTTTASVMLTTSTVASATQSNNPTASMPSLRVTTPPAAVTAPPASPVTRRTTTTIRTLTSRRTFMPPIPRTSPPRVFTTVFISPFTTTTESPPQQCNITEKLWVKTVVSIYVRRNRLDSIQRQNLRRGLSQGLRKALNDSSAQAQVETVFGSPNMTVAYHVTGADIVYPPSVVLDGLASYGRDRLIADLRQYLPMVTALPLPVTLWRSIPATGFQLKTVLQFVGAGDDPRSCRFSQMMEQRLEKVFSEAQAKVLHTNNKLSVQMLSVSQAAGSPAVSLVYTVRNGTVFLNGTSASNLLGQLSAELVGYFLFYPPLIIAEPLEYHNLNTSIATRDFWLVTVIQDVDNASLEGQYQSFASLMEQRLAELFVLAGQQGTRFRRATTVGGFTVQMVSIRRVSGVKNPAEMTYYVQHNGVPLIGTSAAKVLNTVDSQTMALTLGYFVQLQAEPVVKNPPNNLWILAAVLAPISVVTLIIIIITAVLCRKNKNDFKADAIGNLNPRAKMAYRRDVGYYHQPVQGFDYAKQHLGQQGGDEETLPASQDTLVMSLQIRDTPLSLEKALQQDGTGSKKSLTADKHKSKLPSEDGSVISNESEKLNSCRGLTVPKVTAQQKLTKEETRKRDDPYDTSSGSLQLISIKPMAAQTNYSHPASTERSRDSVLINGEVNLALKQKSDIEHYRNKLRLKAKRKGYYDFPSTNGSSGDRALVQRQRPGDERAAGEHGRPLEPDDERGSTYVKSHRRQSQVGQTAYRSRQSLSSPSPGGTEMDLLVMRERPRRGIRNSGYDTEPELIEETNVDRLVGPRGYMYGRGLKGHSETSTLSSQPSIDEVRQQMHLLLEEAFSLASGGQSTSGRHSHHHHQQQPPSDHYSSAPPPLPYADVVTSAPGTMTCERGGLQWVPSYGTDVYQCSLPKPAFRFTQLPEMAMGSPPPLPPRTGPPHGTPLRRSTSDLGPKGRSSETSVAEMRSQHDNNPYGPTTRAALPPITAEQPVSNYSGNPITAVYAIPATRSGYSEYFVSTPPTSYHSPSWMSYPPEPEDVPPQWADSVPLPGYVEAFPHPRYPQGSPTRLPLEYNQTLEQPPPAPSTASQQSLPQVLKDMDSLPLSSLSTSALVQAIRQEVAKLAKKQNDMFEF